MTERHRGEIASAAVGRRETFADETSTGRFSSAGRGARKAIVAAQVDGKDYGWWRGFCSDHFPGVPEPKSPEILTLIQHNPAARPRLLAGLVKDAKATIVIIEFSEQIAQLVRLLHDIAKRPLLGDPLDVVDGGTMGAELTKMVLREARKDGLEASAVPRIEYLFQQALNDAPFLLPDEPEELINRKAYNAMDAQQQGEVIGRFSVAFAEALDPRRLADILTTQLAGMRFLTEGHLAYRALDETLSATRTFDKGSRPVFQMLTDAHKTVVEALEHAMHGQLQRRAGALQEEDSKNRLGIQVADVAAGVAARDYELAPGTVREKVRRVQDLFGRVLLNGQWI